MGNAKTPTGDSKTSQLTPEQAQAKVNNSESATVVAIEQEKLPQIVEVDILVMEPENSDRTMTKLGDKTRDTIKPIVAGRKGEFTGMVYENGHKVIPPAKDNRTLKIAQERLNIAESAEEKLTAEQNGGEGSPSIEENGQRPEDR